MTYIRSLSLGAKLNLALLIFLLLLGAATSAIVLFGFNRTQDNARARSDAALEDGGRLALQAVASGAGEQGGLLFETVAETGRRSARYLDTSAETGPPDLPQQPALEATSTGHHYDPNPNRVTDLVVINGASPDDSRVREDIAFSAPLDAIFPVLLQGFAGEVGGRNLDPTAIVFISTNGVTRYYPPIGIQDHLPGDADFTKRMVSLGPEQNPERRSIWTSPYEDGAGQGLIVTARTPVYDGDVFRGSMEVDVSMANVIAQINQIKPTPRAFAFYVDASGTLLQSDAFELLNSEIETNKDLSGVLAAMRANPRDNLATTDAKLEIGGEDFYIAYNSVPVLGGTFAVAAPVSDITSAAAGISSGIEDEGTRTIRVMLVAMSALFIAGLAGATYLNRRAVIRPIAELADATRAVASGDLRTHVSIVRDDELGQLANSFNGMVEQLRESERALEQRVEDRTRDLNALLRADAELFQTLNLDGVLQALVDVSVDVLGAHKSLVMLHEGEVDVIRASRSFAPENIASFNRGLSRIPHVEPAPEGAKAQVYADVSQAPEFFAGALSREGVISHMFVPIRDPQRMLGVFGVSFLEEHTFTEDEQRLYGALADRAAVAIQNAELYEKAQQAASLEERQRLARELHDSVSQALYGIALGTRTARLRLGDDPNNAAEPIDYVMSLAEAGLAEMRALIFELRPESLQVEGIVAAIEKQVASTKARYNIEVKADVIEEPDCALDVKEALYRITQEALHNVVKHAQAQHVEVRLEQDGDALLLTIHDDGHGFDTAQSFPGHVGLHSMPERAAKLGGTVTVESSIGVGTSVVARVPV